MRLLLALLLTMTALSGCEAPTLPLPPPRVEALSVPDSDGIVTISGDGAISDEPGREPLVIAVNARTRTAAGSYADASGRWVIRIEAMSCDIFELIYIVGTRGSQAADTQPVPPCDSGPDAGM
jgi:hypothetical protein